MAEQNTRTAATVIADWFDEHGFGGLDTDDLQSLSAALADAGYTIAGPGQVVVDGSNARQLWEEAVAGPSRVVVDRGRFERLQAATRYPIDMSNAMKPPTGEGDEWTWVRSIALGVDDIIQPGDLDPLPTREGE